MSRALIFLMGVQRSGTNALFRSLRCGVTMAFNEKLDSPVFDRMMLRPESEVMNHIGGVGGPVLFKPISESKQRNVVDVFREYARQDLRVVWLYRDPVNCFASHIERWTEYRGRHQEFSLSWCQRNQMVLDAIKHFGERIAVVRYRDLIVDPSVVKKLGEFLGVRTRYRFRSDSDRGRKVLDTQVVKELQGYTSKTMLELDESRTFKGVPKGIWRQRIARIA